MQLARLIPPSPETLLVFPHVPKTGGTTLHDSFGRFFGPDRVFWHRRRDFSTHAIGPSLSDLSPEVLRSYRFVSGHFEITSLPQMERETVFVGLVRDPVARFLSDYYFNREFGRPDLRAEAQSRSPESYLAFKQSSPSKLFDNHQIFALTGTHDLAEALDKIDQHYLLACSTAQLDRAQRALSDLFGFPDPAPRTANPSAARNWSPDDILSEHSISVLRDRNEIDLAFIEAIEGRFEQAVAQRDARRASLLRCEVTTFTGDSSVTLAPDAALRFYEFDLSLTSHPGFGNVPEGPFHAMPMLSNGLWIEQDGASYRLTLLHSRDERVEVVAGDPVLETHIRLVNASDGAALMVNGATVWSGPRVLPAERVVIGEGHTGRYWRGQVSRATLSGLHASAQIAKSATPG